MTLLIIHRLRRSALAAFFVLCGVARVDAMEFRVAEIGDDAACRDGCPQVMVAEGEITNDSAQRFLDFVRSRAGAGGGAVRNIVFMHSPGGVVAGAMQLGLTFRTIDAAVVVARIEPDPTTGRSVVAAGSCMSACAYALFGGTQRVVPHASRLGIHRMYFSQYGRDPSGGGSVLDRRFAGDDIVKLLTTYTKIMGVDPRVIAAAEQVSPDTIHIVSDGELAKWRLGSTMLRLPAVHRRRRDG